MRQNIGRGTSLNRSSAREPESIGQPGQQSARLRVTATNVCHAFGTRTVLKDVSLHALPGEVCVVSGSNGSGKSTLLRILAGLIAPNGGEASAVVDGEERNALDRRQYIGYVAPDLTLYRELSGAENLLFFARLKGLRLDRDDLVARLTAVGLRGRGRDPVGAYSSGMRQRLKYAFALLTRPPILLLDEPTANLDRQGVDLVEEVVAAQRARQGGGITIVATNEPREVQWGDTVVRLDTRF